MCWKNGAHLLSACKPSHLLAGGLSHFPVSKIWEAGYFELATHNTDIYRIHTLYSSQTVKHIIHLFFSPRSWQCPDYFVVGYGLDFAESYRNLPYVGILKPEMIAILKLHKSKTFPAYFKPLKHFNKTCDFQQLCTLQFSSFPWESKRSVSSRNNIPSRVIYNDPRKIRELALPTHETVVAVTIAIASSPLATPFAGVRGTCEERKGTQEKGRSNIAGLRGDR
ncbi:Hypoxanthine-guanine phosphoribosyltransferase [Camellia lanceoleosa]|uniref:Hypoxanthine-guanine phosphoribosyltransferase n=1 Tax=Camellia lanceoleosa TaxID=1840588 RepID=A0ACC0GND9_9ERIC|nr:Hypoxanthine-guanine phosphoribosyltransferase [Camellia lanceoleosa]